MGKGKSWIKYILHAATIIGVIWAGLKYIDGEQFQKALHTFDWRYAPVVALLGVGSLVIKAWRFASMLKKTNDVDRSVAMKAYIAGQSATLLPGGIAARAAMLDQIGIKVGDSSPSIALSSFTDQLGFLTLGIVSALYFEPARKPVIILIGALALLSVVLGVEASRTWLINVIRAILGRFKMQKHWDDFVATMKDTLSVRLVATGVINALMAFSLLIFGLYLCLKGVGADVPIMTIVLAYSVPTMLGRIAALPGGFGVTEVGMIGILDQAPNVSLNQAAAAVLIFRLGTVVFGALFGGLVYIFSWRHTAKEVAA